MRYEKKTITVPAFVLGERDGVMEIPVIAALGTGLALYREDAAGGYQIITISAGTLLIAGIGASTLQIARYWLEQVLIEIPIDWNGTFQQLHERIHTHFSSGQSYFKAIEAAYKKACERSKEEAEEQEKRIQALTVTLQRTYKALQQVKTALDVALQELEQIES